MSWITCCQERKSFAYGATASRLENGESIEALERSRVSNGHCLDSGGAQDQVHCEGIETAKPNLLYFSEYPDQLGVFTNVRVQKGG